MNILLVNDDGYDKYGLEAVKDVLKEYGTVYMFAPLTVQSGKGCALSTFKPIKVHKQDEFNYIVDGTPVDCVQMAKTILGEDKIDLVVSGCNHGYNLSNDTLYSGTCGACVQGVIFHKKAIAFSGPKEFDKAKISRLTKITMEFVFENNLLSNEYWLNVNFFTKDYDEPKGIKLTKLFIRDTYYEIANYDKETDIYNVLHNHSTTNDSSYDVCAVEQGFISITPLYNTFYNENLFEKVKEKYERSNSR